MSELSSLTRPVLLLAFEEASEGSTTAPTTCSLSTRSVYSYVFDLRPRARHALTLIFPVAFHDPRSTSCGFRSSRAAWDRRRVCRRIQHFVRLHETRRSILQAGTIQEWRGRALHVSTGLVATEPARSLTQLFAASSCSRSMPSLESNGPPSFLCSTLRPGDQSTFSWPDPRQMAAYWTRFRFRAGFRRWRRETARSTVCRTTPCTRQPWWTTRRHE